MSLRPAFHALRRPFAAALASASIAAVASLAGCGGSTEPDKFPDVGHVLVDVVDASGHPVSNVLCDLRFPDLSLSWRSGRTDSNGHVEIGAADGGVLPGDYRLVVTPPAGDELSPGQDPAPPVTVVSDRTVSFTVHVQAIPASGALAAGDAGS